MSRQRKGKGRDAVGACCSQPAAGSSPGCPPPPIHRLRSATELGAAAPPLRLLRPALPPPRCRQAGQKQPGKQTDSGPGATGPCPLPPGLPHLLTAGWAAAGSSRRPPDPPLISRRPAPPPACHQPAPPAFPPLAGRRPRKGLRQPGAPCARQNHKGPSIQERWQTRPAARRAPRRPAPAPAAGGWPPDDGAGSRSLPRCCQRRLLVTAPGAHSVWPKHCPPPPSPSVAGTISLSTSCSAGGGSWPPPAPSPCCPSSSSSVSGITSAPASCPSAMTAAWLAGCPPAAAASKAPPSSPSSACAAAAAASGEPTAPSAALAQHAPGRRLWQQDAGRGEGTTAGALSGCRRQLPIPMPWPNSKQTRITACAAWLAAQGAACARSGWQLQESQARMCGSVQLQSQVSAPLLGFGTAAQLAAAGQQIQPRQRSSLGPRTCRQAGGGRQVIMQAKTPLRRMSAGHGPTRERQQPLVHWRDTSLQGYLPLASCPLNLQPTPACRQPAPKRTPPLLTGMPASASAAAGATARNSPPRYGDGAGNARGQEQ